MTRPIRARTSRSSRRSAQFVLDDDTDPSLSNSRPSVTCPRTNTPWSRAWACRAGAHRPHLQRGRHDLTSATGTATVDLVAGAT